VKVLVMGAGGMLGRDVVRACERPDAITLPSWKEGLREYLAERESGRSEVAA
jgi:hypothetical protein